MNNVLKWDTFFFKKNIIVLKKRNGVVRRQAEKNSSLQHKIQSVCTFLNDSTMSSGQTDAVEEDLRRQLTKEQSSRRQLERRVELLVCITARIHTYTHTQTFSTFSIVLFL
jgi:predicted RNase H-like nuclease